MNFKINQFLPSQKGDFIPSSVTRLGDNETFIIGDYVTNGFGMSGHITGFSITDGIVFVSTTWSGVGIGLYDAVKSEEPSNLPSACQVNQVVSVSFIQQATATVRGVHFYEGKVKYDLELWLDGGDSTRIYNVDSFYVNKIEKAQSK